MCLKAKWHFRILKFMFRKFKSMFRRQKALCVVEKQIIITFVNEKVLFLPEMADI